MKKLNKIKNETMTCSSENCKKTGKRGVCFVHTNITQSDILMCQECLEEYMEIRKQNVIYESELQDRIQRLIKCW